VGRDAGFSEAAGCCQTSVIVYHSRRHYMPEDSSILVNALSVLSLVLCWRTVCVPFAWLVSNWRTVGRSLFTGLSFTYLFNLGDHVFS